MPAWYCVLPAQTLTLTATKQKDVSKTCSSLHTTMAPALFAFKLTVAWNRRVRLSMQSNGWSTSCRDSVGSAARLLSVLLDQCSEGAAVDGLSCTTTEWVLTHHVCQLRRDVC